jgi:hypothetical protein
MLILIETPAGFALFELKDKGVLKSVETICDKFVDAEQAKNM